MVLVIVDETGGANKLMIFFTVDIKYLVWVKFTKWVSMFVTLLIVAIAVHIIQISF